MCEGVFYEHYLHLATCELCGTIPVTTTILWMEKLRTWKVKIPIFLYLYVSWYSLPGSGASFPGLLGPTEIPKCQWSLFLRMSTPSGPSEHVPPFLLWGSPVLGAPLNYSAPFVCCLFTGAEWSVATHCVCWLYGEHQQVEGMDLPKVYFVGAIFCVFWDLLAIFK